MSALSEVVSDLVDAAFRSGGITDAQHTDLHAKLDGSDQPAAPAVQVEVPTEATVYTGSTEGAGFNG